MLQAGAQAEERAQGKSAADTAHASLVIGCIHGVVVLHELF